MRTLHRFAAKKLFVKLLHLLDRGKKGTQTHSALEEPEAQTKHACPRVDPRSHHARPHNPAKILSFDILTYRHQ